MACGGCGGALATAPVPRADIPARMLEAALMCAADCPHLKAFTLCTIKGKHPLDGPCPQGRHPDEDGVIHWEGEEWVGIPAPLRRLGCMGTFRRMYRAGASVDWRALPGCGRPL